MTKREEEDEQKVSQISKRNVNKQYIHNTQNSSPNI